MKNRIIAIIMALTLVAGCGVVANAEGEEVVLQETATQEAVVTETTETATTEAAKPETTKPKVYKKWVKVEGKKYYYNGKGKAVTGWKKIKSSNKKTAAVKWCYFNKDGVFMKSVSKTTKDKTIKVDGKKWYFTKKSKPLRTDDFEYYNYKYKTYVLVDISEQKLYYYKNKKRKMQVPVITGTPNSGIYSTPTGKYKVTNKYQNIRLKGPTWDEYVYYWIGFIGGQYGFHDATWRDKADWDNKNTYKTDGSHGCVNLRKGDIASLFGKLKVGNTVIIRK